MLLFDSRVLRLWQGGGSKEGNPTHCQRELIQNLHRHCMICYFIRRQEGMDMSSVRGTDIQERDSRPRIPPCVMASSVMGLKLGVFKTQTKCVHNLRAPCGIFMHVYLHAQTAAVHTHLMNHGYFDRGENPEFPQFEPHARIKVVQVLGSPLYICGLGDVMFILSPVCCFNFLDLK